VTIYNIFLLLGGLGLFIYGMKLMSDGLKLVAGHRLKKLLGKVTKNRWIAAGAGAVVTAVIQSSTATTVMVLGLVNSGLMTLFGAITVIIGANVGTTISSMLLTFNIQPFAPFIVFVGTILVLFIKQKTFNRTGLILLGFGVLFLGLGLMSDSMRPLRDAPFMADLFEFTRNPLIGILIGFAVTALIQSSTATIGIILSMISVGIINDLHQAVFLIYGLNLGGTVTALIASIGANKATKQTAAANLVFNLFGVLIFVVLMLFGFDMAAVVQNMSNQVAQQLVYTHIIFNVVVTLALLPLAKYVAKVAKMLVKSEKEDETELKFYYIDRRLLNSPDIAIGQTTSEIGRMMDFVQENYILCAYHSEKKQYREEISQNEEVINFLDKEINKCLILLNTVKLDHVNIATMAACYRIIDHLERIGNYSTDITSAFDQYAGNPRYSESTMAEVGKLTRKVDKLLQKTFDLYNSDMFDERKLAEIQLLHDEIITLTDSDALLTDISLLRIARNLNRISTHALQIAQALHYRTIKYEEDDYLEESA